ncbi:hypothetical protein NSQ20_18555 [Paenibacillus sp. FSL K6-1122]|uniref:hypothetical protein n=1 Tax=Paenibacillus sp. FSL K6-1122 TaxID=2954512 RepID=UPI0030EC59B6
MKNGHWRKITWIVAALLLIMITACGNSKFNPNEFSEQDLAVTKTDSEDKITYGMSQEEAEKILGEGTSTGVGQSYQYNNGITIGYRDAQVVSIILNKDSKGYFKTARGAEAGMTHQEILDLYGKEYVLVESERNIDYAYHIQKETFLDEKSLQAEKDDLAIYRASFMLTKEGQVNQVILLDHRFATTFK